MPIKFPKVHIAQSVANRIMNIADGLPMPAPEAVPVPVLPDVAVQGIELDAQLKTPPTPTELPEGADGALVGAALGGEDLALAAVDPLIS